MYTVQCSVYIIGVAVIKLKNQRAELFFFAKSNLLHLCCHQCKTAILSVIESFSLMVLLIVGSGMPRGNFHEIMLLCVCLAALLHCMSPLEIRISQFLLLWLLLVFYGLQ